MYYYTAYQLIFKSYLLLPEFFETVPSAADIQISLLADSQETGNEVREITSRRLSNGILFDWGGVGRYEIRNANQISIAPRKDASEEVTRIPLYNVALAAVLQQNNLLVLHGSAVEINGKAIILLGNKGHGKSFLSAALVNRGHNLVSDDVTAISFHGPNLQVLPGIPIVKLWPDAISAIGFDIKTTRSFYPDIAKRLCLLKEKFCKRSLPLGAIFILDYGEVLELKKVSDLKKLLHLSGYHYFSHFRTAFSPERHRIIFDQCSQLARQSDMYEFIRRVDLGELENACQTIEDTLSG